MYFSNRAHRPGSISTLQSFCTTSSRYVTQSITSLALLDGRRKIRPWRENFMNRSTARELASDDLIYVWQGSNPISAADPQLPVHIPESDFHDSHLRALCVERAPYPYGGRLQRRFRRIHHIQQPPHAHREKALKLLARQFSSFH